VHKHIGNKGPDPSFIYDKIRPHGQSFVQKNEHFPAQIPHCQKNEDIYPDKPENRAVVAVSERPPDYAVHVLRIKIEGRMVNGKYLKKQTSKV
jgi:hypothetical protein